MKKPPRQFFPVCALACLLAGSALGQGISLVKDINTQSSSASSFPGDSLAVVNGTLFIATDDRLSGAELWKMADGQFSLVKDIVSGIGGSNPKYLTAVGSKLFFVVTIGGDDQLWMSDGSAAGTKAVVEKNNPLLGLESPKKLFAFGNTLYFEGDATTVRRELWKCDQSGNATLVKDIYATPGKSSDIEEFIVKGDTLYFTATDGTGREIWKVNNATGSAEKVTSATASPEHLGVFLNQFFFSGLDPSAESSGTEVWKADGVSTAAQFFDVDPSGSSSPSNFCGVGSTLFFAATTGAQGRELWSTDGISVFPSAPVKDIRGGADPSDPEHFTAITVGTTPMLLFTANDGASGVELWRSNNTSGGTVRVADIAGGSGDSNPSNFITVAPTTVLFTATNASNVLQLWKCEGSTGSLVASKILDLPGADGTTATTATVRSLVLKPETPGYKLYLFLNDDELWQSDGTAAGTTRIKRFRLGGTPAYTDNSDPADFTPQSGTLAFFTATDGLTGRELWKTDGTEGGTAMVADIFTGTTGSDPQNLVTNSSTVFFSAIGSGTDRELWKSDGMTAELVKDINSSADASSDPSDLFWSQDPALLFFAADDGTNGRELWRSDGTDAGTFLVKNMALGSQNSNPHDFVTFNGSVYCVGTGSTGTEIFATRGILNDVTVLDIQSGGSGSNPSELTVMAEPNNPNVKWLYFVATANSKGREIWRTNGTDAPTTPVKDIVPAANASSNPAQLTVVDKSLFFTANDGTHGVELWKTDGTEAGTVLVKDIAKDAASSNPAQLIAVDKLLFFVADDGVNGAELWVSNGTATGTTMVRNIVAGNGSPGILELRNISGVAAFTADDGVHGRELWISDGTNSGTKSVPETDLTGDSDNSSSSPQHITNFNGRLIYSAATYATGQEPYIGNLGADITVEQPVGTPLATTGETVDFDTASLISSRTVSFRIANDGVNGLKSLAAAITGPQAKEFTLVAKPPATLSPGDATTMNIKFAPKGEGARNATLTITSSDPDEGTFTISLTGTGEAVFTQQPQPRTVQVGDDVTFTVTASMAGDTAPVLQWKKGGAAVPGASSNTLELKDVTLAQAGDYSVQAKVGTVSANSAAAKLCIVDNTTKAVVVAEGANGMMKVDVKGSGPFTYQWWRQIGASPAEQLAEGTKFKGTAKNGLTVSKTVTAEDSGLYFCLVTGPGPAGTETVTGGTTDLRVFNAPPVISASFDLPDGVVSGTYFYQIPMDLGANSSQAATTFTAKNLPTGLKLDGKTGIISGKPTKPGDWLVTITAANKTKVSSTPETVHIDDLPPSLAGVYVGLVERSEALNSDTGGRIDVTVTTAGGFSGTLTLGTTKYPVKGVLDVDVNNVNPPSATLAIKRAGVLGPLTLYVEFATNTIGGNSQVNDGTNIAAINGWRQVWNSSTKIGVANPATDYLGYYTLGLSLSGGPDSLPQGTGYGSFTVAKDGKLSVVGKTADGEGITCGSFLGPNGEVLVYQPLYLTTPKGSVQGQMMVNKGASAPSDNAIGGLLDWVRPQDGKATARTYKDGFGAAGLVPPIAVELDVHGGRYGPITGSTMVMGLSENDAVRVVFTEGGLADTRDADSDPDQVFALGPKNKVVMPKNDTATSFTLAAGTGLFSGSFALVDDDLLNAGKTVKRSGVKFQGIIFNDGINNRGVGYFMLPQLPDSAGETLTKTEILSGAVIFEAAP